MNKTAIEWCDYTWNPVVGCIRGCKYCYARRIHNRFSKTPFWEIHFFPERLVDPLRRKAPATIFVGSMSDVEYWEPDWLYEILEVCDACPQHTFMFLSKSPGAYIGQEWPANTMQGLTITSCQNGFERDAIEWFLGQGNTPRPFLSVEPLLGNVDYLPVSGIEMIIAGAMTGPGATPVREYWLRSFLKRVPKEKMFLKASITNSDVWKKLQQEGVAI